MKRARAALFWFSFFYVFALLTGSDCVDIRTSSTHSSSQDWTRVRRRSLMGGPGSYPPRCVGKCGWCTPCRPVHVTVPPGSPVTAEYYPEAWRCKCGDRIYVP